MFIDTTWWIILANQSTAFRSGDTSLLSETEFQQSLWRVPDFISLRGKNIDSCKKLKRCFSRRVLSDAYEKEGLGAVTALKLCTFVEIFLLIWQISPGVNFSYVWTMKKETFFFFFWNEKFKFRSFRVLQTTRAYRCLQVREGTKD